MRYDEALIEQIQSSIDIVEVISSYIPLRRSGKSFKAVCPFHQEKTPSFYVHPEKQIFHCFGCGAGGDVYSFLMRTQNLTFPEAVKELAARTHIKLPESESQSGGGQFSQTKRLLKIYLWAFEYYRSNFEHPEIGKDARRYVLSRGFDLNAAREFGFGFAPRDWRRLLEAMKRKDFGEDLLVRSGLAARSSQGTLYDLLRNRLILPIWNHSGKVVAFGGRVLDDELPKYINSPETEIFKKRRELYGLHLAKRYIPEEKREILIVEGYLDAIRLYSAGFRNVVATLGTALTEDHVRILRRYAEQVILIYDGDKAGEAASLRSFEVFLEGNLTVKVLALPTGYDPDRFVLERGKDAFGELLGDATDFFDFKLSWLLKRYDPADSYGVVKIAKELLGTLARVRDRILQDRYVHRLSETLEIHEDSVRTELMKLVRKSSRIELLSAERAFSERRGTSGSPATEETLVQGTPGVREIDPADLMLFQLMAENPNFLERGLAELEPGDFENPSARSLFESLRDRFEAKRKAADLPGLLRQVGNEAALSMLARFSFVELSDKAKDRAFTDCLARIKRREIKSKLQRLQAAMKEAEASKDEARVQSHVMEYQRLLSSMKKLVV